MNDMSRLRTTDRKNRFRITLPGIKSVFEVLAYVLGAIFLLVKLLSGQENAGMDVSLELKRVKAPASSDRDQIGVTLKLKRSDIGRITVDDIVLDVIDLADSSSSLHQQRTKEIIDELETTLEKRPQIKDKSTGKGLNLPPNDATQLAYWFSVKRGSPIRVDATITATRTPPWIGHPQWRASAISLPGTDAAKSD